VCECARSAPYSRLDLLPMHGPQRLSYDVLEVTPGRTMARPDNVGGVNDMLCKYFAVYWQRIVH